MASEESQVIDVGVIVGNADQRESVVRALRDAGFRVGEAWDHTTGTEIVLTRHPRVVLCDYDLPEKNGVELCRALRQAQAISGTYLVLLSSEVTGALMVEAHEAGADDYLAKPIDVREVVARVRVGMRMWSMQERLRCAAITDGLTGLYNHDHFNRVLEAELSRAQRYGHPLALMMIDIDRFKIVNDSFGHLAGNDALERIGIILRQTVRSMDSVGRFGGDEFAIVLPQADAREAAEVGERIRLAIAESLQLDVFHDHIVTASIGIADSNDPGVSNAASLIDLADRALYLAKRRGRNQVADCYQLHDVPEFVPTIRDEEIERLREQLALLNAQARDIFMQSVASLLQALDEKDPYTSRHAINVAFYAQQLAEEMGCAVPVVKTIYNAALLHDVGKVGVPDRILMKKGALSSAERRVMDQVPLIGARVVSHLRILQAEMQIIRHQRESFDGSGLPAGLSGERIPLGSRVLMVADAFDAMTTERVYRPRCTIDEALVEVRDLAGRQFDPRVVEALESTLRKRRSIWQQRIDDTVQALGRPGELTASPLHI
jgi:diguanylate cyclase (GGDEF)-like protein